MSPRYETTKADWINALRGLGSVYAIETDSYHLKSPTFIFRQWRVGIEHQRQFRSIVIQWKGSDGTMPDTPARWKSCPASDQDKGWLFRVYLKPHELHQVLDEMSPGPPSVEQIAHIFQGRVEKALKDTHRARHARLATASKKPKKLIVTTVEFERNADVVAEVLNRAAGICGACGQPAPFKRRSDGSPYLEVHHNVRLADGGDDTVENAIALCPNCHRRSHYA